MTVFTLAQLKRLIADYMGAYVAAKAKARNTTAEHLRTAWEIEADACKAMVEAAKAEIGSRNTEGK